MVEGLDSICDLLRLYQVNESVYLRHRDSLAHRDCRKAVEKLYTDIFEYQAQLICYLSKGSIKRAVRGTFQLDGWRAMLEKVKESDKQCNRYFELISVDKDHQLSHQNLSYGKDLIEIQKRISEIYESAQLREQRYRQDDHEAALLKTLSSDYESDKDSNSVRVAGTCEWFFEDKRFLDWRNSRSSKLLWVSAGPGCGKSVLARALVDERRVCTNAMASTVCYFFFKDGQEQRTHATNALSAILHQLFRNRTNLITYGLPGHKYYGDRLETTFSELWEILAKAAEDPEAGEIICVLDALDECKKNERDKLITKLVSFFSKTETHQHRSFPLKFLVTSRHYDHIEGNFEPLFNVSTFVRFDSTDRSPRIAREINLVIDAKMPDIARHFCSEDRESIRKRLKEMDNRTYLWLFLTIKIITGSRSKYGKKSSIDELLSNLPPKVSDAYERILDRSPDRNKACILLQLIVATTRPLTLEEANVALTLATQKPPPKSYMEVELWPSSSFESTVQNICGLFVSIHDGKLSLIHQTAREFLLGTTSSHSADSGNSGKWQGSFDITEAHGTISKVCLDYLSFEDIPETYESERKDKSPLFNYAAKNWPNHYTLQSSKVAKDSREAAKTLCRGLSGGHWLDKYDFMRSVIETGQSTSLAVASLAGLVDVVEEFLTEGADVDAQDDFHGSALQAASSKRHYQVVQILLERGADINAQGGPAGGALHAAACVPDYRMVQLLLEKGADVNPHVREYNNPLQSAADEGFHEVVHLLLEKGADIDAPASYGGNALQLASYNGRFQVVQLLLDKGADINAQAGHYDSALQAAAYTGQHQVVQILLDNGANVNIQGGHYDSALQAAACTGQHQVVQILLDAGADVNTQGGRYGNALQAASAEGHYQVVQILLDAGANVNAQGGYYGNALKSALSGVPDSIVLMLLKKGFNLESADLNEDEIRKLQRALKEIANLELADLSKDPQKAQALLEKAIGDFQDEPMLSAEVSSLSS